jgi:hypothetical protein
MFKNTNGVPDAQVFVWGQLEQQAVRKIATRMMMTTDPRVNIIIISYNFLGVYFVINEGDVLLVIRTYHFASIVYHHHVVVDKENDFVQSRAVLFLYFHGIIQVLVRIGQQIIQIGECHIFPGTPA